PVAPTPAVSLPGSDPALVPVLRSIPTTDRVVFITIDDGYHKDPAVLALLRDRHVPVTPFLAVNALQTDHDYFGTVQDVTGQHVQDHTMTHPFLSKLSYAAQKDQICGAADQLGSWYGTRPWLFRPPYGDYSQTTRRAAKDCGMTALVLWDVSLPHHVLRYASGSRLHPGDIVLIHWRPNLAQDLPVVLDQAERDGLRIASLQDYLPAPS
ncbi:MAG TPA: polysaccharide deacetylase family protein, partial [Candidatus Nanopelagicales bacterium]|nr:polysaccharide deacetylase family protein [Candidatus Nanopelagicales bacterium]